MSYKMLLNRKKFLNETEFGRAMEKLVREWDGLLETKETPETIRKEAHCMSQWEVYQLAMKQFYGLDCHFTRTDEYFGIWIEDDASFLLKVDRAAWLSQRVTRRGIKINGVEYWDDDFIHFNLGKTVMIKITSDLIRVYGENGTPLHSFRKQSTP